MLAKKIRYCFCLVALSVPVAASAQSTLSVGQRVKTTANVNVRSKPTNAKKNVLGIQTTGSVGAIVGGPIVATATSGGTSILILSATDGPCTRGRVERKAHSAGGRSRSKRA